MELSSGPEQHGTFLTCVRVSWPAGEVPKTPWGQILCRSHLLCSISGAHGDTGSTAAALHQWQCPRDGRLYLNHCWTPPLPLFFQSKSNLNPDAKEFVPGVKY